MVGQVGAVVAAVRHSKRRQSSSGRSASSLRNPQHLQVEEAHIRVLEYGASSPEEEYGHIRKVRLPLAFRQGQDGIYAVRQRALLREQLARDSQQKQVEKESTIMEDARSEASDSTVASKSQEEPLLEPFARYLSQQLGRTVTGIFYPAAAPGGGWKEFRAGPMGLREPLPFVDGMLLVLCFDGERPAELPGMSQRKKPSATRCHPGCSIM